MCKRRNSTGGGTGVERPPGPGGGTVLRLQPCFMLSSVMAGATRDSEPLLLSTTRTGARCRTRSELSHGAGLPDPVVVDGDTPVAASCLCRAPRGVWVGVRVAAGL